MKVVEYKNNYGALFEFLKGKHVYGQLKGIHFQHVGELMGKIHKVGEENNLKCSKMWEQGNFWRRIEVKVDQYKPLLSSKDIKKHKYIEEKHDLLDSVPQYFIHGDYHFANILFNKDNNITGLLDFDDYRMGHFMDDLVRFFICELIYTSKEYYRLNNDFVQSFFKGYTTNRDISDKEKGLIPIYFDLHYLSGLISLKKKDTERANLFKEDINQFRKYLRNIKLYNEIVSSNKHSHYTTSY